MGERILIVRHAPGRGRMKDYMGSFLEDLAGREPTLSARLELVHTGQPAPSLDGVGAVVFWLADPLRELYPGEYGIARAIAERARDRDVRVVNPPDALSNSVKSVQSRLWQDASVPSAVVRRYESRAEYDTLVETTTFPAIIRADLGHRQHGLRVVHDPAAAHRAADEYLPLPGVIGDFVDVRESFRDAGHDDLWAAFYNKKRALVLGGRVRTQHLLFAPVPIVTVASSLFRRQEPRRRARLWRRASPRNADSAYWADVVARDPSRAREHEWWQAAIAADNEFARLGVEHEDVLVRAQHALGIDWMVVDYATLADGSPVLWEANPYFHLRGPGNRILPQERRSAERLPQLWGALARFLRDLCSPTLGA